VSRRRTLLLGWTLALPLAALFAALGFWQHGRGGDKQATLDAVDAQLAARSPQPLALAADAARADRHDWAAGAGRFAEGPAVLLDNQQREGRVGVRAYRVFLPEDSLPEDSPPGASLPAAAGAAPLLVELGWLPLPGDRTLPSVPRPVATRVAGLLAPPPSPGIGAASAVPQPDGSVLATALDLQALAPLLGQPRLAPRVLKLDPALPFGHARDLDVLPNTLPPERHLGYALQWWALSLAVLAVALVLSLRRPRARRAEPE
jgi:surfeit locus 1 family protein